jgi:hypothetical protein
VAAGEERLPSLQSFCGRRQRRHRMKRPPAPPHSAHLRRNCIYWLIWSCCVNNGPGTDYL